MFVHHDLCCRLQIAGPAVIAESGPQRQNLVLIRVGEGLDGGQLCQKSFVVRQGRFDLGLLQHDL